MKNTHVCFVYDHKSQAKIRRKKKKETERLFLSLLLSVSGLAALFYKIELLSKQLNYL